MIHGRGWIPNIYEGVGFGEWTPSGKFARERERVRDR
jgi:hypothetical protein